MKNFEIAVILMSIILVGALALNEVYPYARESASLIRECQADLPRSKKCKIIAVEATDNTQEIK